MQSPVQGKLTLSLTHGQIHMFFFPASRAASTGEIVRSRNGERSTRQA